MRILMIAAAGLVAVAAPAAAQYDDVRADDIKLTRDVIRSDREKIVRAAMKLDSAEAARFWPVYREYRVEQEKNSDRSWKALTQFADNYETMDEATSKMVIDEFLSAREGQAKLARKWHGKFAKAIGEKKALRYYQIESKLDQAIQGEIVQQIPLAR